MIVLRWNVWMFTLNEMNHRPHNSDFGSKWQRVEVLHLKDSLFWTDWLNPGTFIPWRFIQQFFKKAALIILMWKHCQNIRSGIHILSDNIPSVCMGCCLAAVAFVVPWVSEAGGHSWVLKCRPVCMRQPSPPGPIDVPVKGRWWDCWLWWPVWPAVMKNKEQVTVSGFLKCLMAIGFWNSVSRETMNIWN